MLMISIRRRPIIPVLILLFLGLAVALLFHAFFEVQQIILVNNGEKPVTEVCLRSKDTSETLRMLAAHSARSLPANVTHDSHVEIRFFDNSGCEHHQTLNLYSDDFGYSGRTLIEIDRNSEVSWTKKGLF